MFEKFKPGRKAERPSHESIIPVEGLEGRTFSLPESNQEDKPVAEHKDDWVITAEQADNHGNISLTLSRYKDDGSIETRSNIPADVFAAYQVDVDSERRVHDARKDSATNIGASAVRMSLVGMVRSIRSDPFNEKYAGLEAFERRQSADIRQKSDEEHSKSLGRIEEFRNSQRRENPVKGLQRGAHHPGRQ